MTMLDAQKNARMVLGLVLISFICVNDAVAQQCYLPFVWENKDRHVDGVVNQECGSCPPWSHTAPWGNWGVNSVTGSRTNGTQFMGWQSGPVPDCNEWLYKKEWNSCTPDFTSPAALYFNYNNYTEQFSGDIKSFAGESISYYECPLDWNYDGEIDDGGCGNGTGSRQFSFGGRYMKLYELDPFPGIDQLITQLNYSGTFVVQLWCDGWSCEAGESAWKDSSSNPIASSPVRVRTVGGVWSDPNGCCDNGVNYCE